MCHLVREIRESWEGKEGVNLKEVNVKSFHYFDKILQINRKIFRLAIDDINYPNLFNNELVLYNLLSYKFKFI